MILTLNYKNMNTLVEHNKDKQTIKNNNNTNLKTV